MSGDGNTRSAKTEQESVIDVASRMRRIQRNWRIYNRGIDAKGQSRTFTPFEKAQSYLKREVYVLGAELVARGEEEAARTYARLNDRPSGHDSPDGPDLYKWLLSGFSEEELGRSEKRRYSHELQYARRHQVPPQYLVGFIYQCAAGDRIYEWALDGARHEQWYKEANKGS